jgi:hypothetical protein
MNEKTPPEGSLPIQRPADPFTAQDAARLFDLIQQGFKKIGGDISDLSNRVAVTQKNYLEILERIEKVQEGLSENRIGRLELELREAEIEREIAERNLRLAEEKVNIKETQKDKQIDTHERMKAVAAEAHIDIERKRKESNEAFILDVRRSIIKAVLVSLSVAGVTGAIGFIWWLFQLYVNRGGP